MEISPRELRDADIPTEFRGYSRDVVDDFLERAATTIEALQERNRQLTERLQMAIAAAQAQAQAPTPAPAPQVEAPAPVVEPEPVVVEEPPAPVVVEPEPVIAAAPAPQEVAPRVDDDLIQRTLILAQKAADQTIAEANAYALRTKEEANTTAAKTIADATAEMQRIEHERTSALEEVLRELENRKVSLEAGIDLLERFDTEYRSRLRSAIESDLRSLEARPIVELGERPEVPQLVAPVETTPAVEAPSEPVAEVAAASGIASLGDLVAQTPPAPVEAAIAEAAPVVEEPLSADVLDDDAFFASLREAVRNEAPLGADDEDDDKGSLFS
jgi:cell division septum initiation protein DivIVA